jgi:hypothetical protein
MNVFLFSIQLYYLLVLFCAKNRTKIITLLIIKQLNDKTSPDVTFGKTSPDVTFGKTSPDVTFGKTSPDVTFGKISTTTVTIILNCMH